MTNLLFEVVNYNVMDKDFKKDYIVWLYEKNIKLKRSYIKEFMQKYLLYFIILSHFKSQHIH